MPDTGDAEKYLAGAAAILGEYPPAVGEAITDPRTGTRLLKDFPSLHDLRKACDKAYEPIERAAERRQSLRSYTQHLLENRTRPPRTPEDQARIDAQVTDVRRLLGLPPEGIGRRRPDLPPSADMPIGSPVHLPRNDGRHAARVAEDLAQRQIRKDAHQHEPEA